MGYKMLCGIDPREVGIENENGSWDFEKFKEHIKGCKLCSDFVDGVLSCIVDVMSERVKNKSKSKINTNIGGSHGI